MHRYGWLVVAGVGWAILVGGATFVYARWAFARRGWTPGGVEAPSSRHRPRVRQRLRRGSIRVRVAAERTVPLVELVDTAQAAQPARPVRAARPAATPVPEPAAPPQRVEPAPVAAAPAVQRVAPPPARPAVNKAGPEPSAGRTGRPSTLALLQRLSDEDPTRRVTALREATGLPDADRIM